MAIASQRFCINRKIAPSLSIEAFFRLVNSLGLNKVELRNDLPSGKVTDDLSHQQVRELADRYHIEILTINAVYPFNCRTAEVRSLTESLLKEAKAVGAKSLVLCPLNDGTEVPASETLNALRDLAPLFVPFKLLIDTFHHHLYPQAEQEFNQVDIGEIGLVHLSGVEDSRPREALTDNERIMLTAKDQLQSCEQVKNLEARGYQGVYAFEPFAPELANWSEDDIRREIEQSIALIQRHCA